MSKQITNKLIRKQARKLYSFKLDKKYKFRRTYMVFHRNKRISWGNPSKAKCISDINWMVNYDVRDLRCRISKLRELGFKVTTR